jgi:hypothetical protein
MLCKRCLRDKDRTRTEIVSYGTNRLYVDEYGDRWHGRTCPHCVKEKSREARYRNGIHRPKGERGDVHLLRGFAAEGHAAEFFKFAGFRVERGNYLGPDLHVWIEGQRLSVEVKLVQVRKYSLTVNPVKPSRRGDNLIAYVHPDGRVRVENMSDHLREAHPSGGRTVTKLFKED